MATKAAAQPDRFEDMTSDDEYTGTKYGFMDLDEAVDERENLRNRIEEAEDKRGIFADEAEVAAKNAEKWRQREDRCRELVQLQEKCLERYWRRLNKVTEAIDDWDKRKMGPKEAAKAELGDKPPTPPESDTESAVTSSTRGPKASRTEAEDRNLAVPADTAISPSPASDDRREVSAASVTAPMKAPPATIGSPAAQDIRLTQSYKAPPPQRQGEVGRQPVADRTADAGIHRPAGGKGKDPHYAVR